MMTISTRQDIRAKGEDDHPSPDERSPPPPRAPRCLHLAPRPGQTELVLHEDGHFYLFKNGETLSCYSTFGEGPVEPVQENLEVTAKDYEERAAQWRNSPCFSDLKNLLEDRVLPLQHLRLDNCIGLGFGSFTSASQVTSDDIGETAMTQLAAFEAMVEILRQKHDIAGVFVQEPRMNALDKEFLQSRGITVLETPQGENRVTSKSLVYAPGSEQKVTEHVFQIAYPGMFVGGELEWFMKAESISCDTPDPVEQQRRKDAKAEKRRRLEKLYQPYMGMCEVAEIALDKPNHKRTVYWKTIFAEMS